MNLHLMSNSDNFSIVCSENECRLTWYVHLDLSAFNTFTLTDFRLRPATIPNPNKFATVSCNLVKSDVTNPHAIVHVTTSFNHPVKIPGMFVSTMRLI